MTSVKKPVALSVTLTIVWSAACLGAPASQTSSTSERVVVLETGQYASAEAARAAWTPAERGSPPVDRVLVDGKPRLSLPTNFAANNSWRVAWDLAGRWDLSACQTIRLELTTTSEEPVGMILYLHSGDGWYGVHFVPGLGTADLPRKKFNVEDRPGGWDRIDRIRLSILRRDEECPVTLLGIAGVSRPAGVAVYANGAGLKAEPGVTQYVRQTGDILDRLAIAYEVVGDEEVAAGRLAGKKVAVLPLNPVLPRDAAAAIEKFVGGGGKLIVCYCLPAPLEKVLGVRPAGTLQGQDRLTSFRFKPAGDRQPITAVQASWIAHRVAAGQGTTVRAVWTGKDGKESAEPAVTSNANGFFVGHVLTPADQRNKDLLVQEMIGELWPGMWEDVAQARAAGLGKVAGLKDEAELRKAILANRELSEDQKGIDERMAEADRLVAQAKAALLDTANPAQAAEALVRAQDALTRAYAASVAPRAGEFRAVWCHSHTGVAGMTWDEALKRLADAGFNAIIPNLCWGYSAAYESKVLPRAPGPARDQLAECLAAAKKYGVAVHVWRVNWNLFWHADPKVAATLRAAGRLQEDAAGKPLDWLCPSNPENQKLELDAMLEIARNYEVAGLHFDYIRYPGEGGCFCAGCRQRFEAREGAAVKNWPADVTAGPLRARHLQFRRDNITALVAAVSDEARKVRPGIKVSAAVFPDWQSARDQVGQDWKLWVEKGYLDFVCPMQYTENASWFAAQTKRTIGLVAGRVPLMPGIGATLGNSPDGTLQEVLAARQLGAAGFVLFNYEPALLQHLDLLRLGATKTQQQGRSSREGQVGIRE